MSYFKAKMHQIRSRLGLRRGPLAGSKGREGRRGELDLGRDRERQGREEKGRGGRETRKNSGYGVVWCATFGVLC